MQKSPSSVLVAGEQSDSSAQHEFEKLAEAVSKGELRGVVLSDEASATDESPPTTPRNVVRRGAVWGARAGFLLGTISLLAFVIIGAVADAVIAKASKLRIEKGSAPRIRFV